MVDPVTNEAASKLAEQQSTQSSQQGNAVSDASSSESPSFQEVLEGKQSVDETSAAEGVQNIEQTEAADRVEMNEIDEVGNVESHGSDERRVKLKEFMEGISEDRTEIDSMFEQTMNGSDLDQKELLEMQALIYSYSQKVELTSKVVEKGTGGLKQMMQMQV